MTATVPGVTPQPRGIIPPEHVDRIKAAMQARNDAAVELRRAVVEAMRAGGSVREVAALTGLSTNTVQRWSREAT